MAPIPKEIECMVVMGDPSLPDQVKRNSTWNPEDYETIKRLKDSLATIPGYRFSYFNDHKKLISSLSSNPPQFVLNLCDEGYDNNPFLELHVPALLEMLKIPYTGAAPQSLAICYNKALVRAVAQDLHIAVPYEIVIDPKESNIPIPDQFPVFVKPSCGDSSVGITEKAVVQSAEDLVSYCEWLKTTLPNIPVLVQEFLSGKEYTVGLIGNGDDLENLPILEVDYSSLPEGLPPILGYESKWLPDSPYWNTISYKKTTLDEAQQRTLVDSCKRLFNRLECRDYARFDFRADVNGVIKLLEANPNPGWCWDGKLNMMAGLQGWNYAKLLEEILRSACNRLNLK